MNPNTALALLLCFLLPALVQSAPTPPLTPSEAIEQTRMVVEKILSNLPAMHAATVKIQDLTFDPPCQPANHQMMAKSLAIPAHPVIKRIKEHFLLDTCVSHMSAGSQLYQELVGVLSDRLSSLSDLKADLRDLWLRINKMKELCQLSSAGSSDQISASDLVSRLPANFDVQVAVHQTLCKLRSFCHDMIRGLRDIEENHRLLLVKFCSV